MGQNVNKICFSYLVLASKFRKFATWFLTLLVCCLVAGSSKAVVVAIVDTGIDTQHPSLQNALWINPGETGLDARGHDKATNQIDDDANGFVDDLHGWSFIDNSPNIQDQHGHGTHIAGIITGHIKKDEPSASALIEQSFRKQAPLNIKSVNDQQKDNSIKVMILKYYDKNNSEAENLRNSVLALNYALKMGAQIVNYSGGGFGSSLVEKSILMQLEKKNVLVIAAAGNEKVNTDIHPFYPAAYKLSNILSVAATDWSGEILNSSNYGQNSIDIAATGSKIISTLPNGKWGAMTGTSQATAIATAKVANIMLNNKKLNINEVKQTLFANAEYDQKLLGKTKKQLRLVAQVQTEQ